MNAEKKVRKESFYDQNGFRTDEFSLHIFESFQDPQQINNKVNRWKEIIPQIRQLKQNDERKLIYFVRQGIPDLLRREVWPQLIIAPLKEYSFYHGKMECKQIDLDLNRTFPENKIIRKITSKMKSVLNAIAYALPKLGYCQGMNFISAILLLKLEEQQAFDVMYHIFHWEKHQNLLINLDQIHRKMYILDRLVRKFYPKLHKTLEQWQIDCLFYASPWFITLFCNTLPCSYVLRIIQMYLLEGQKILYRAALQILKIKKKKLKKLSQFDEIMEELRNFEDLGKKQAQMNKFFCQMFQIKLSRKQIEQYDKQFTHKQQLKKSLEKPKK